MSKFFLSILTFFIILNSACKNELDLNAPYKEIMVVYSLLNANDSIHYVKVNKAFITENQSAYEVAKISDSLYYDSIKVELTELETGKLILFKKDYSIKKDSGIFANDSNVIFSSYEKLNEDYTYKAKVTNLISGNTTEAITNMVKEPKLVYPSNTTSLYSFDTTKLFLLNFNAGLNAKIYDVDMVIYWDEFDISNVYLRTDSLSYPLIVGLEPSTSGVFNVRYDVKSYFSYLASNIPVIEGVERKAKYITLNYWGANDEYLTYKKIYSPSTTLVQKKPEYTNFSNGNFGLLASRNFVSLQYIPLDGKAISQLRNNSITRKLNFK